MDRKQFISSQASIASVGGGSVPESASNVSAVSSVQNMTKFINSNQHKRFRPANKSGFGGVAIGNGFNINPDVECLQSISAAWNAGVRYFDTSPWYGLGISERRLGLFLKDKVREEYVLSSKVGRILEPKENFDVTQAIWKGKVNFGYRYDFTADGVRRSIEDSLQRLGVSSLDIVYIHDLSPDNGDMGKDWLKYFEIARKGAMPELTRMREEGIIKAWGLGVNTVEPILKTIDAADPDIFLSACQYSLIHHEDDLNKVFPKAAERDISIVVGAPLCAGFLSGKNRYLYEDDFPEGVKEKLAAFKSVAASHNVDLRTAALQFCAAPEVVSAVIPGAHTVQQVVENAASFSKAIPADFWAELKNEKLIHANAPLPQG
ncbi:D-threo-aldose 1-dehydrogenase [Arcticibacter pallidicorallinus]|uniref:D-threo-aldose 1-dehydrogenase n=1 Tax=Arcticibacter pallidicorallinus TaxID=1259464 RepID=A0A2T0U3U7_9SPHI|nr:aldo/keto reductase [Arcticibacter pallidicorallinus]PRY52595.1 D-threo-aldose 1-dehydrogenase [Arcticibacter pallidicorallinus]